MTQPEYVPIASADRVRPAERLPVPDAWLQDRPAELIEPGPPSGPSFGRQGPDQGYAFKLARGFETKLTLSPGLSVEDVLAGGTAVATKRSALFGRAPVIYDLEVGFAVWGFLGGAPEDLIAFRRPLFEAASHHYELQREIADRVTDATLRLAPSVVRQRLADWRALLLVD